MISSADVDWFRVLFDANFPELLAYAARRVISVEDAKDVVAEVFTVAWRRRAVLPDDSVQQRMWLYGVARRVLANRHRTEFRLSRLNDRLSAVGIDVVADPASVDDQSDVAVAVQALNALEPNDREVLLLSLWEELTPGRDPNRVHPL